LRKRKINRQEGGHHGLSKANNEITGAGQIRISRRVASEYLPKPSSEYRLEDGRRTQEEQSDTVRHRGTREIPKGMLHGGLAMNRRRIHDTLIKSITIIALMAWMFSGASLDGEYFVPMLVINIISFAWLVLFFVANSR
jgi:hypothetical protein